MVLENLNGRPTEPPNIRYRQISMQLINPHSHLNGHQNTAQLSCIYILLLTTFNTRMVAVVKLFLRTRAPARFLITRGLTVGRQPRLAAQSWEQM